MASARGQILPAERLGKHKTSWQIITVVFFLVLLSVRELKYAESEHGWWFRAWNQGGPLLVWIAVGFTVYSGLRYAWRHRDVIAPDQ
jgi:CDP-diacylglycerol--glycerol-3-phosphate 3-phosphatidyltransferase/cardiolipin synthase